MQLREDAISIWRAGLAAVDSTTAIRQVISHRDGQLRIAGHQLQYNSGGRIEVLGAGKAGAGMAAGLESALAGSEGFERLSGWVNVPADCLLPLQRIHLHPARPPGRNEPTPAVVTGTEEILQRARSLRPDDVCIVLLSGGASALLCSPIPGITLQDKLEVTRLLSASGAPIQELNLVRTQLSQVKGGGLANAVTAGSLVVLVISDVIGDPLDVIGSGPTIATHSRKQEAIEILQRRSLWEHVPQAVRQLLHGLSASDHPKPPAFSQARLVHHRIVASNSLALQAAATRARELGYHVLPIQHGIRGEAADAGLAFSAQLSSCSQSSGRWCLLGGGETTVNVTAAAGLPGRGGRNQEFVLAAAAAAPAASAWTHRVLLSGGTDGEDGPTPAAGAFCDAEVLSRVAALNLDLCDYLARHDSFSLFEHVGGLLITGPTQTNVMDLAVGLTVNS